jgi:hypothetical protein
MCEIKNFEWRRILRDRGEISILEGRYLKKCMRSDWVIITHEKQSGLKCKNSFKVVIFLHNTTMCKI